MRPSLPASQAASACTTAFSHQVSVILFFCYLEQFKAALSSADCLAPSRGLFPNKIDTIRYSPNVKKIEVLERNPVKRAKLYYLRDRAPKEYRVT